MSEKKNKSTERDLENYLYTSDKKRIYLLVEEMTQKTSEALKKAAYSLEQLDKNTIAQIADEDDAIDDLLEQIDQECLYSIAMRQPVREDLRYVYAVMKIIIDIERIGDQAVNIAERTGEYITNCQGTSGIIASDVMCELVKNYCTYLERFLKALRDEDGSFLAEIRYKREEAMKICSQKSEQLLHELATVGAFENKASEMCITIDLFRHLKRISDHLLNLGENVYFIANGISPRTLNKQLENTSAARKKGDVLGTTE